VHLGFPNSVALFIAQIICGLISVKGIWLKDIAASSKNFDQDTSKVKSRIRRLQRLFGNLVFNYHCIALMLYAKLGIQGKVTILLDRTNWDYGKSHINIFVAAALYRPLGSNQSFAIPIVWEVFDKKGNSNTQERKRLINRLLHVIEKENIEAILGDREFIGQEWIQFLHDENIPFIIRIKNNMYVEYGGKRIKVSELTKAVVCGKKVKFDVQLDNVKIQLAATKSTNNELVVVIASIGLKDDLLDQYRLRWLIELFFKSIKSKGFDIENTHMTDPEKIKKLFALIAIATLAIVHAGIVKHHFVKRIPIKKHGRPEFSIFTYGRDFLHELFAGEIIFAFFDLLEPLFIPDSDEFLESKNQIFALGKG
jgi:hypothetical protein